MTEGTTMTAEREAIVRIAKGLTEAQRRTMLWPHRSETLPIMIWSYPSTMNVLERKGLLGKRHGGWFELSPLGLAVRDHLKESTHE